MLAVRFLQIPDTPTPKVGQVIPPTPEQQLGRAPIRGSNVAPPLPSGPGSHEAPGFQTLGKGCICLQKTSQAWNSTSSGKPSLMLLLTLHLHRALRIALVTGSNLPGQWRSTEAVALWLCAYRCCGEEQAVWSVAEPPSPCAPLLESWGREGRQMLQHLLPHG